MDLEELKDIVAKLRGLRATLNALKEKISHLAKKSHFAKDGNFTKEGDFAKKGDFAKEGYLAKERNIPRRVTMPRRTIGLCMPRRVTMSPSPRRAMGSCMMMSSLPRRVIGPHTTTRPAMQSRYSHNRHTKESSWDQPHTHLPPPVALPLAKEGNWAAYNYTKGGAGGAWASYANEPIAKVGNWAEYSEEDDNTLLAKEGACKPLAEEGACKSLAKAGNFAEEGNFGKESNFNKGGDAAKEGNFAEEGDLTLAKEGDFVEEGGFAKEGNLAEAGDSSKEGDFGVEGNWATYAPKENDDPHSNEGNWAACHNEASNVVYYYNNCHTEEIHWIRPRSLPLL
jgi:hypothetical protein